jgi:hypothetical protein
MNGELVRTWMEAVVDNRGICVEGLKKIFAVMIPGVPAEIRIEHLANTGLERRRYGNPLGP